MPEKEIVETPRVLLFYTKPGCGLCVEAFPKVERVAARYGFSVRRIDIESDPDLFARHRYRIPVVEWDGSELGWGRISERALERDLRARL